MNTLDQEPSEIRFKESDRVIQRKDSAHDIV